jgi:hypothetical protein
MIKDSNLLSIIVLTLYVVVEKEEILGMYEGDIAD